MNICELFLSIDGEGKRTGLPCVFVRKSLCNMRPYCSYCDTSYSFREDPQDDVSVDVLVERIADMSEGCKNVTFTGGEPLYYKNEQGKQEILNLVRALTSRGYNVNVETNGSIDLSEFEDTVRQNGFFTMDWKSLSSNVSDKMLPDNLDILDENDVLKFVVGDKEDLDQMKQVLERFEPRAQIYVSPIFGKIDGRNLVQYILDNRLYDVKVQLQLHKYLWSPDQKGV